MTIAIVQNDMINTRWLELGTYPINDAGDYFSQSLQYLFENEVYSIKGRIIFPIINAGLLGVFKLDLSSIQLLVTFLLATITFCATLIVYKNYGYKYSLLFSSISLDYVLEHVGGVCTEVIGYILALRHLYFFLN